MRNKNKRPFQIPLKITSKEQYKLAMERLSKILDVPNNYTHTELNLLADAIEKYEVLQGWFNERQRGKGIKFYLKLPYKIVLQPDYELGGYVAYHPELPGCMTQGETIQHALKRLKEAKAIWIESSFINDKRVPLPRGYKTR